MKWNKGGVDMNGNEPLTNVKKPREICEGLYVIHLDRPGGWDVASPAILTDGDETILFGIGLKVDFPEIVAQLKMIRPLETLKYLIAPGLEKHLISTLKSFHELGADPVAVVDEKLFRLLNLSVLSWPIRLQSENDHRLFLKSGRVLDFLPTPFVISAMAFMTYDSQSKTLFSHYLFDSVEPIPADADLAEQIRYAMNLCANYVPSSDFIRPVVNRLAKWDIERALTQSGKVIEKTAFPEYSHALSAFEFYNNTIYLSPQEGDQKTRNYRGIASQVLLKWRSVFGSQMVLPAVQSPDFTVDPDTMDIGSATLEDHELWNRLFETVYLSRGLSWLVVVEPLVEQIVDLYGVEKPTIFRSAVAQSEQKIAQMDIEKSALESRVEALESHLKDSMEKLTKDPLTKHYNELFLSHYLEEQIGTIDFSRPLDKDLQLYFIQIDNILAINTKYSVKTGDETIRNLGYLLEQVIRPQDLLVKRNGPGYIVFVIDPAGRVPSQFARTMQNAAKNSDAFIEPVSLSVAVVRLSEFPSITDKAVLREKMRLTGETRIKSAARGAGMFLDDKTEIPKGKNGRILIADGEEINLRLLESLFFNENFDVKTTKDGLTALQLAKETEFDAIIAERTIPKLDGMLLKQNLNQTSVNNQTLFILLTYNKNPEIVRRANQLGIDLVIQKPAIFEEMSGLIERAMAKGGK